MPKRGIVNVKMIITEEKILSNIEKVQRLINPNSKKQIIELDDNTYFKDLVESIKAYLIEYPKKKNFPKNVYDEAFHLVEYATEQFEENTKQIEMLIKQREKNIKSAIILKQILELAETKDKDWQNSVLKINGKISEDVVQALQIIGKTENKKEENYIASVKLVQARISNLQSNLHIEIDMERVEDRSKALSYIGIEIADALKLIPTPAVEIVPAKPIVEKQAVVRQVPAQQMQVNPVRTIAKQPVMNQVQMVRKQVVSPANGVIIDRPQTQVEMKRPYQDYYQETRQEVKPSLWQKFKNSKIVKAFKYVFKIRISLQLPESTESNYNNYNK